MEVDETERVVVAKPVAYRPNSSRFKSSSDLLAGTIESPCSTSFPEPIVPAIRPKTVRLRPAASQIATAPVVSSQAEVPRAMMCDLASEDLKSQGERTVIYKPKAERATRSLISLSENMGSFRMSHQLGLLSRPEAPSSQDPDRNGKNSAPRTESDRTNEPSKAAPRYLAEEDIQSLNTTSNVDGSSYDGFNWRKYGQKQVKGSEYPRSYYKCTHPNCPMKKKVERSFDGQIREIVYEGKHNHAKPQPLKRGSSGTHQGPGNVPDNSAGRSSINHLEADCISEGNKSRLEKHNTMGSISLSTNHGKGQSGCEPDSSYDPSSRSFDGRTRGLETENDGQRNKRRKSESQLSEPGILNELIQQDGHVVVQSSTNTDPLSDGFRWRKYGQKVVKGSPYPRSYYRCTSLKCNVRKHVERASDDPTSFVTTYEGKHNHGMQARSGNQSGDHQ